TVQAGTKSRSPMTIARTVRLSHAFVLRCIIAPICSYHTLTCVQPGFVISGSPSPSHPTVRAVFPHTAVRQSSCPGIHRGFLVPDRPAANVDDASGIQDTIRILFPSVPTAFTLSVSDRYRNVRWSDSATN